VSVVRPGFTRFWAAALMAICVGTVRGLPALPVSPAADSDAVLALRPAAHGELRLQYRKEEPGTTAQQVSLGLAADYHYIQTSDEVRIYDYQLRRIFWVRPGDFVNNSLYAEVWFRAMELKNRALLGGMLSGAGIVGSKAPNATDPFWLETELGMVSTDLPHRELKKVGDKSRVRWLLDTEEVASVRYDKDPVPDALKPGLHRFWRTIVQLHPDIADALAADGRVPAELSIKASRLGKEPSVAHWTLTSKRWEPSAPYPLPAHLPAKPTESDGVFPDIYSTLAKRVSDKALPVNSGAYMARAEAAIGNRAGLEALLWVLEMSLAEGTPIAPCVDKDPRPYCTMLVRAGPLAKADPRTAIAFMKQAPDQADRAQFANLPNAYLLRLLWATRPPGKGVERNESERDLLAALQASPVANFCKDTGDFYAAGWQPFAAWQAWDFGRLMAGHRSGDLLSSIDTLETSLATQVAVFF